MNKLIKSLVTIVALYAFVLLPLSAQEPGNGLKITGASNHYTTKTTWTPVTATCRLYAIAINTSNAGTAWTLQVQDKESTAKIVINALTLATTQNPLVINFAPYGITMTNGIDVTTAGTTAGVADVFLTYR